MTSLGAADPSDDPRELAFEAALDRLEKIVAELERGRPDLAAALASYEAGLKLLKHCHSVLDRAERNVAVLIGVDADGNPLTGPFDATPADARNCAG